MGNSVTEVEPANSAADRSAETVKCVDGPFELADILAAELEHIRGTKIPEDKRSLDNVFQALKSEGLTSLCFSGGGIRSATFGLGVVEALALYGLLDKFDYLST